MYQYMIKCITVYKTRCILTCYISCYYLIMPFCINKRRGIANAEFFFNIYMAFVCIDYGISHVCFVSSCLKS